MSLAAEIAQQYEVLRSRVLADEGERVFRDRNVSVEILISQGMIGWSKLWDKCGQDRELSSLASDKAVGSGSEAKLSCERESEITSILVNMTLGHLKNSNTTEKESNL